MNKETTEECSITSGETRYWVRLYPDDTIVVSREEEGSGAKTVAEGKLEKDGNTFEIRHALSPTLLSWVEFVIGTLVRQRRMRRTGGALPAKAGSAQAIAQRPPLPTPQPSKSRAGARKTK